MKKQNMLHSLFGRTDMHGEAACRTADTEHRMWPMEKRGAEPLRLRPLGVCLRYVRFIYKSGYGPPCSSQLVLLYIAHMPLHPEKAPADAMVLPGCRVLSALYYGDYNGLDEA